MEVLAVVWFCPPQRATKAREGAEQYGERPINLIQIMRRARQGVDAILPGGYASVQWTDEEVADLANEAYESMQREFRLVRRKWNMVTLNVDSAAFTREDETYTPATALVVGSDGEVTLPPDFAELVRVTCTNPSSSTGLNHRGIRLIPSELENEHWIDVEEAAFGAFDTILQNDPTNLTFYYDIIGNRTLRIIPRVSGSYSLEIDYIPMLRPLVYTNAGTVAITNGLTDITGTTSAFNQVYSAASGQKAEIIVGASDPQSNQIRVDRDYPGVSTIASATSATLASVFAGTTVTASPYILTMAPNFPREYHRWMSRLTSSLMLAKVNPDVSDKYFAKFMTQFKEQINPAIRRRQSQASQVVEDADEFGMSDF